MTTPLKLTAAQVKRLERNLNPSKAKRARTRDYKNRLLDLHLETVEKKLLGRRLRPDELQKFRGESLKAFIAFGMLWKE